MFLNTPRALKMMKEAQVDALLGSTLENVYYLSGAWSENFLVTPRHAQLYAIVSADRIDQPYIVAGLGDTATVVQSCPDAAGVFLHGSFYRAVNSPETLTDLDRKVKELTIDQKPAANPMAALVNALQAAKLTSARIAIDERGVSESFVRELEKNFPKITWVPGDQLLRRIRSVKTHDEIALLVRAMEITEGAIRAFYSNARENMTEEQATREFDAFTVSQGASPKFSMLYFGNHSAVGQIARLDGKLLPGQVGRLDVGCVYRGYNSDLARSYSWGKPAERALSYYQAALKGEDAVVQAMRPGVRASELFKIGVETVRQAGIPQFQRHHIGHAVGLEVYDLPTLNASDDTVLEENMIFEVELPYYELGLGGIQPEDTVLVTPDGGKMLTSLSRDFMVLS